MTNQDINLVTNQEVIQELIKINKRYVNKSINLYNNQQEFYTKLFKYLKLYNYTQNKYQKQLEKLKQLGLDEKVVLQIVNNQPEEEDILSLIIENDETSDQIIQEILNIVKNIDQIESQQ